MDEHIYFSKEGSTGGQQVGGGGWLESHLVEGRQDYVPGRDAVYGQSITDACISLEQTEPLLEQFARAQKARGLTVDRLRSQPSI